MRKLLDKVEGADPEDVKRIQNYIEMGYNRQGRSLILFSCAKKDFWWAFSFAVPVDDFAFVSFRPYVRQLAHLLDVYERCGVVQVDQEGARIYVFNMGNLEAVEGYLGEEVKQHRSGGWSAPRYQRREEGLARQNLQEAAEMAEEFYRNNGTRRLILAGTGKNVATFKDLLSNRLRSMIIGAIAADANASPNDLRDKALALAVKAEKRDADALADQILAAAQTGGNAVLGVTETLTAVQQGRASHVIVVADYAQQAYRFVDSGHVLLELTEDADLQSGRVQLLPDAVESCLRRALVQNIGFTVVDHHDGLEKAGKIGALTRY
ncbi:MAG: hypothetical protein IPK16_18460 [Anaerolineales bacterium]|nr:hypothetical protein [Anaerolineales bacterium]